MRFTFFRTTREGNPACVVKDTTTGKELWLVTLGQASGARNTAKILNDPTHYRHTSLMEIFDTLGVRKVANKWVEDQPEK